MEVKLLMNKQMMVLSFFFNMLQMINEMKMHFFFLYKGGYN
jgi:hypothetical protein